MYDMLPVAAFAAVALGILGVASMIGFSKTKIEERLDTLRNPAKRGESVLKTPGGGAKEGVFALLRKASPALSKPLQPKTAKEAGKLKAKLSHAGFRSEHASSMFSSMKVMCGLFGLAIGGGLMMVLTGISVSTLLRTVFCGALWFYLPEILLYFFAKRRKEKIFLALPDCLDLMVVCVEAGLALDQAMRKVATEMTKSNPIMSYEFQLCNMQLQWGRSREEVLTDLGERNGVDDLKSLAAIIIQADKFGSSIAHALRVQSDAMRVKRRQIAEEKAAKTAVKLIFPLVIFIFPGIFVVLVGPAAITMVNEMLPAFQNR